MKQYMNSKRWLGTELGVVLSWKMRRQLKLRPDILKKFKSINMVIQKIVVRVSRHDECKSGLHFRLSLLTHKGLVTFFSKLMIDFQIFQNIRPLSQPMYTLRHVIFLLLFFCYCFQPCCCYIAYAYRIWYITIRYQIQIQVCHFEVFLCQHVTS